MREGALRNNTLTKMQFKGVAEFMETVVRVFESLCLCSCGNMCVRVRTHWVVVFCFLFIFWHEGRLLKCGHWLLIYYEGESLCAS